MNRHLNVDLIFLPTAPEAAFRFGAKVENPLSMYLLTYTVTANLVGVPAISFPIGFIEESDKNFRLGQPWENGLMKKVF